MLHLVINLDRSPDRWESISAEFQRMSITPERISGVDGKELSDEFIASNTPPLNSSLKSEFPRELTKGEIGCFLSHKKAWERLIESGERWACIVEDDVTFSDRAPKYLLSENWIPENADVIQLHTQNAIPEYRKVKRRSIHVMDAELITPFFPDPLGAMAYIISRESAKVAIQGSSLIAWAVDDYLFAFKSKFSRDTEIYRLNPAVVKENEGRSDVGDRSSFPQKPWRYHFQIRRHLLRNYQRIYAFLLCNKELLYFK